MIETDEKARLGERSNEKKESIFTSQRPSQARRTTGQTEPCESCAAVEWIEDSSRGEIHCGSCGLVVEDAIPDPGAEWTNHGDGNDRSRVGAPTNMALPDKGLNTVIDRKDLWGGRAGRNGMNSRAQRDWRRRVRLDERSKNRNSRERNLVEAMKFIRDRGELPSALEQVAAEYYRKAIAKNLVMGRSIRGVTAACVYLTARENNLPRRIEDVAENFDMSDELSLKELRRTIRLVSRNLGLHKISGPEQFLDKFASDLELSPQVLGEARYIWKTIGEMEEWQGKRPSGVAGALLYKAAGLRGQPRTQADVCEVAGVSEVTLRGLMRILEAMLKAVGEASEN
ncbi:MAG TPA: transcription initiation factor IIB family protein [Candidatus Poseidoniales archaeon]|jgi:transcription initiation factor TFIIB|nr:transcription initiation factor IIB family protein [Candidatus Poseidoniales archaeon]